MSVRTIARRPPVRRITSLAGGAMALLLVGAPAGASSGCRDVAGRYTERVVSDGCTSPVELCVEARFGDGALRGTFSGRATALVSTADTPTTGVVVFTSDSVAEVEAWGRRGTLLLKNAGAFHTTGPGEIVNLQTILGGTGDFTGASGALRASGLFDPEQGTGTSEFEGTICVP